MAEEKALDAFNVGIAKGREGGYAAVAPANTDPTAYVDVSKTIAELIKSSGSVLKSLGYISEDGVTNATDTDTSDIKDWGANVIKSPLTSYGETIQVGFLESRDSVLKVVFGEANVTTDAGTTIVRHNTAFTGTHLFVFDSVVSETKVKRIVIPNGVITERDDIEMNSSDPLVYTPTIKCLPSPYFDGDCIREYIYDTTYVAA